MSETDPTDPPTEQPDNDAVEAARQMNDPDGAQPGVVDDAPEPGDDDALPEQMP